MLTCGQAAKLAHTSKTSIRRALDSGRLSGTKDEAGQWMIDPAELQRVYPAAGTPDPVPVPAPDLAGAALERENTLLRDLLEREREISRDLAADRDAWRRQATHFLPPPAPPPGPVRRLWQHLRRRAPER